MKLELDVVAFAYTMVSEMVLQVGNGSNCLSRHQLFGKLRGVAF